MCDTCKRLPSRTANHVVTRRDEDIAASSKFSMSKFVTALNHRGRQLGTQHGYQSPVSETPLQQGVRRLREKWGIRS